MEIGRALSKTFATGDIKREEVFITSKLWSTSHRGSHVSEKIIFQELALRNCFLQIDEISA